MKRAKRIPQRTCVGCRRISPKRALVRIVRLPAGGVEVDPTGKKSGRGAYLCPDQTCWEAALEKRGLDRALKVALSPEERARLLEYGRALAQERPRKAEQAFE
jgi:predicted RNA-binding protein YlxR (DUF448 family)